MKKNTLDMIHEFLREEVRPGALCIDATAGKGRDTALLCELAGDGGRVIAMDIQPAAVEATSALLRQRGFQAQVVLDSHAHMGNYAEAESVDCIVFNLGRLPGGDPHIVTQAESTLQAIESGLTLLKPGGVMTIGLYYGKENGYTEKEAVLRFLKTVDDRSFSVLCCDFCNRRHDPPMPIFIWKEQGKAGGKGKSPCES